MFWYWAYRFVNHIGEFSCLGPEIGKYSSGQVRDLDIKIGLPADW